jgi:hypothetical protein
MANIMSAQASLNHQMLGAAVLGSYAALCFVSVSGQSQRKKYNHLVLRAVGLLREAARCSLRSDQAGLPQDTYADAVKASVYVHAVDRLLSSDEIARSCGISIDELREHTDKQLKNARTALSQSCGGGSGGGLRPMGNSRSSKKQASFKR